MTELTRLFGRVLVANRGEIAVRVIRACRELGIGTVAIYGEGEEQAIHVRLADDAYRITGQRGLPYLDIEAIVEIARRAGARAIHPGYGFLAENHEFANACEAADIVFIGPPASAIQAMGDKVKARQIAESAGVAAVPGTDGPVTSVDEARSWSEQHSYPVAVKAAGGGGGRGFRVARTADELAGAFEGSAGEAKRYFANPVVYLEQYLEQPRHIEIQLFADTHGNVISLGERDCSIQRRHQKLIEETPSPAVGPALRSRLGDAAIALARAVDYQGAGTVEFLLDANGRFYFLEMNTRIQVEHTITEMVTGVDLVKEQIRVAADLPLSFSEPDIHSRGHAIECRINAEDPGRSFAPAPGLLTAYREPAGFGIRIDSAMEPGAEILPAYDSLIAKLATWGRNREEAVARMRRGLSEFMIEGVPTTIPFHLNVLDHPVFQAGQATTTFLANHPEVLPQSVESTTPASRETRALVGETREFIVEVNGRRLVVRVPNGSGLAPNSPTTKRKPPPKRAPNARTSTATTASDTNELISPVQGTVVRVAVDAGQSVTKGDLICVLEAMKMENELTAHRNGTVTSLNVRAGDSVKLGAVIAQIE